MTSSARSRAAACAIALFALGCVHASAPAPRCPGGIDGTFVQLTLRQLDRGRREWRHELRPMRDVGMRTIVIQYTGDAQGAFETRIPGRRPISDLLRAAEDEHMQVFLGLYHDARWPRGWDVETDLPPPLGDAEETASLASLCVHSPACAGWYLPEEIDEETWGTSRQAEGLRRMLARSSALLRAPTPYKPIAIAPFLTGAQDLATNAAWWRIALDGSGVSILMLQDGVGTGRATPATAAKRLDSLRPVLDDLGIRLWSIVEVFRQVHGPPRDESPFEAVPGDLETIRRSLAAERSRVERVVAFASLPYMHPHADAASSRALYQRYERWCHDTPRQRQRR